MADKKQTYKKESYSVDAQGKMHDGISDPVPHGAPKKSVVNKVLKGLIGAGNTAVSMISGLLALTLVLYSGYVLVDTFSIQQNAKKTAWDLMAFKPEVIDDYNAALSAPQLRSINRDYRAWLTVFDTNIDYPVVQGENDLYYASHDIYNQSSLSGAIYLAAGSSSDFSDSYNVIYGHHMDNGAMFGGLDAFASEEYFNSHRTAALVTDSEIYDVEFFAVARTDAYETRIYNTGNRMDEVISFLAGGGQGGVGVGTSVLSYAAEAVIGAEKVVALSTCADTATSGRLAVFGVMRKRQLHPEEGSEEQTQDETTVPEYTEPEPVMVHLTINYVSILGDTVAESYEDILTNGGSYFVDSPEVEGFVPLRMSVEGRISGDTVITVLYVPDTEMIEDFGTPLGLGNIYVNTGDCWD